MNRQGWQPGARAMHLLEWAELSVVLLLALLAGMTLLGGKGGSERQRGVEEPSLMSEVMDGAGWPFEARGDFARD